MTAAVMLVGGAEVPQCPHCARPLSDSAWRCLPWLQFAGAIRSGRAWVTVEVRRCNCSMPVGRECVLPMVARGAS